MLCVLISKSAVVVAFPQRALVTHGLSRLPKDRVGRNLNTEGTVAELSSGAFPSVLVTALVVVAVAGSGLLAVNSHTETSSSVLKVRAVEGVNLAKGSSVALVSFAADGKTLLKLSNAASVMLLDNIFSDFSFDISIFFAASGALSFNSFNRWLLFCCFGRTVGKNISVVVPISLSAGGKVVVLKVTLGMS